MQHSEEFWKYLKYTKWEDEDVIIKNQPLIFKYAEEKSIKCLIELLSIKRNDNGQLELKIVLNGENHELLKYFKDTLLKEEDNCYRNSKLYITQQMQLINTEEICIEGIDSIQNNVDYFRNQYVYTIIGKINGDVTWKYLDYKPVENLSLKEWYLNSTPCNELFFDFYEERCTFTYSSAYEEMRAIKSDTYTNKSIYIELENFCIHINNFNYGLSIEYRSTWGEIPSHIARGRVGLILSFILDRQLFKIGESKYTLNDGKTINDEDTFHSHIIYESKRNNYNQILEVAQKTSSHMFLPSRYLSDIKDEKDFLKYCIGTIITNYISFSDKYNLDYILNNYFVFKITPENKGIPLLVTNLEILSTIIDRDNPSTIISDAEFKNFLKIINENVPNELQNKIKGMNSISIGKKLENLISIYGLNYDRYKEALKIRNKLVHSSPKISAKDAADASCMLKELLTLIVLNILEYKYIIKLDGGLVYEPVKKEYFKMIEQDFIFMTLEKL